DRTVRHNAHAASADVQHHAMHFAVAAVSARRRGRERLDLTAVRMTILAPPLCGNGLRRRHRLFVVTENVIRWIPLKGIARKIRAGESESVVVGRWWQPRTRERGDQPATSLPTMTERVVTPILRMIKRTNCFTVFGF